MEKIVDNLLGPSQYVYHCSKDISDAILYLNEIIAGINEGNHRKLLLSLDFSSAFDSLSHDFIVEVLNFFEFPPQFVAAIKNYLSDNLSCIIMDDNSVTNFFKIMRGTGQGNPLSCLIFILIIEILLIRLNHSPALAPLDLNLFNKMSLRFRSLGFADDLNCLINDNENDLASLYKIIQDFGKLSNLNLDEKKTKLVSLGFNLSLRQDLNQCIESLGYSTCEKEIKILGHIICINDALSAKKTGPSF